MLAYLLVGYANWYVVHCRHARYAPPALNQGQQRKFFNGEPAECEMNKFAARPFVRVP